MSEATMAIAKLRNNKPNPNYRPMIFVIAPFTEVVKGDAAVTETVRSYCRFVYLFQFVRSSIYPNLLTFITHGNFK